ncbi:MAG: hypothetical protein GY943_30370 [Chloroflexi bacterium]|nr:hypothetical protein [Chloroflexota bacterium]
MFKVAYAIVMTVVFIHVAARGDIRDKLGAMVILTQTALVWMALEIWINSDWQPAIIYTLAGISYLIFSIRKVGVFLGVMSFINSALFWIAYLGYLPSEPGMGIAFNVHNLTTIICYLQLLVLWESVDGYFHRSVYRRFGRQL